jgi:LuxR family maltose regulon positive regulatory protein
MPRKTKTMTDTTIGASSSRSGHRAKPRATELAPPRSFVRRIERSYLEAMVIDGLERQLVSVVGPAGYGKTCLLASVFDVLEARPAALQEPVSHKGWLTLAPRHADREKLLYDLAKALGLGEVVALDALVNVIAERRGLTVLFLDQLDVVDPEHAEPVASLLAHAPDNLRIVVASRYKLPFSLTGLRLRGLLTEIDTRNLAFDLDEMRGVLADLPNVDVSEIAQLTQGWPAFVGLLAASERTSRGERASRGMEGIHPELAEFIGEVVMHAVPAPLRDFLAYTITVPNFSVELITAMGGPVLDAHLHRALDDLAPIVSPSEMGAGWLQLHPAIMAYFTWAQPVSKRQAQDRLRSAALWYAERDYLMQSVSCATQAGDYEFAARIIAQAGGATLFLQVGYFVLNTLVEALPADVIYASTELTLCHALILGKSGKLDEGRRLLDELVERNLEPDSPKGFSSLDHVDGIIAIYEDAFIPGLVSKLEALASQLRPTAAHELAWINTILCPSYTALGRLGDARRAAMTASAYYQSQKTVYPQVFSQVHLSLIFTLKANFGAAIKAASLAQSLVQTSYWQDLDLVAIAAVPLAELNYLKGHFGKAEQQLRDTLQRFRISEGWVDLFSRAAITLAKARAASSGIATGLAVLSEADDLAAERNLPRLVLSLEIARADMYLAAGRTEAAAHLVQQVTARVQSGRFDHLPMWQQQRSLLITEARVLLAANNALAALETIQVLLDERDQTGESYHGLVAMIISLQAHWQLGHVLEAKAALIAAIAIAGPERIVGPFLDEGVSLKSTLRQLIRRVGLKSFSADAVEFLSAVTSTNTENQKPSAGPQTRSRRKARTVEAGVLTARELEVLQHLSKSLSNKQIARNMAVSEVTVKFHLKNIFNKLGVGRRDMATAVARDLNLC